VAEKKRKRILTGDRPTNDAFHLGNYVGTLGNRVRLQDEYDTFLFLADLHLLTTRLNDLNEIEDNIRGLVLDYLSVGIDHEKTTIYLQSLVPEVLELAWIFMSLVSVPRAQRIPTLKEVVRDLKLETASMALLCYPILQAADILMVKGDLVPVGKDQLSHVELTREIARRFNDTFAPVFPVPDPLVGSVPTLPGTDGQAKMGKSMGNAIFLTDDPETVRRKVMSMYTDPKRIRADIPGRVQGNPVFTYHDAFNRDKAEVEDLKARYRRGKVGDVEVKQKLVAALEALLGPIRERRARFARKKGLVEDILSQGTARAREECLGTLGDAREAMGLTYFRGAAAAEVRR
jgi:tryptophanyl-tRNA synthetase